MMWYLVAGARGHNHAAALRTFTYRSWKGHEVTKQAGERLCKPGPAIPLAKGGLMCRECQSRVERWGLRRGEAPASRGGEG